MGCVWHPVEDAAHTLSFTVDDSLAVCVFWFASYPKFRVVATLSRSFINAQLALISDVENTRRCK